MRFVIPILVAVFVQNASWTKRRFREVGFWGSYIDSVSVMPVDVDADGFLDIVDVSWFVRRKSRLFLLERQSR
jgi:hypothetical protein